MQAVPLQWRGQTIGVCNLFGTSGETGFATDDLAVTQALAAVATIVVLQRRSMLRQEELTGQLQTALNTRVVIEQAKGSSPSGAGSTWTRRTGCCAATPATTAASSPKWPTLSPRTPPHETPSCARLG